LLGIGPGDLDFLSLDKHLQGISAQEFETFASFFHSLPRPEAISTLSRLPNSWPGDVLYF